MKNGQIQFTRSDIWLLQSIAIASRSRPASLVDIIAVGDWIEHAIFGFGEIQSGLARLIASRCVHYDPRSALYSLHGSFVVEYPEITGPDKDGLLQQRKRLESYFHVQAGSETYRPDLPDPQWLFPDITRQDFEAALAAYLDSPERTLRQIRKIH